MAKIGRGDYWILGWSLVGTLLLAYFLKSGLLMMVALLLGMVGLVSIGWGKYALSRITYTRSFSRRRIFPGETVELTVELTNRKILPVTFLSVEDTLPEDLKIHARRLRFKRLGKGALQLKFSLAWYQKVVRHYQMTPAHRGYYVVGPATLYGGDPFGYVTNSAEVPETDSLVVYPRIVGLESLGLPTRRPFGDLKSNDRLFEDPLRFAGVREYQMGDPLNRVHWKATAASGELQVKLLDPSSNAGLCVFLDTWGHGHFWEGVDPVAFETGCMVAASVANWAFGESIPFGMYANGLTYGWGLNLELPPSRGSDVLGEALEGLARLQIPSRSSIAELLLGNLAGLGYGTSVVVIARRVSDELAGALDRVHRSGRVVTLVLVGEEAAALPRLPGIRIYRVTGEEALHATALA